MLIVRYSSDAERKRLDYVIEKFGEKVRVKRTHGAVLVLEGSKEDVEAFVREVLARIPSDRVEFYRLDQPDVGVEPLQLEGEVEIPKSTEEVAGALDYILAKMRGCLLSSVGRSRKYRVQARGGIVDVRVDLIPTVGGCLVKYRVEGYGDVVRNVYESLSKELSYLRRVSPR